LKLDDARWMTLEGGYRVPYDASHDLRALESGDDAAMSRLWQQLHHQGDVGIASYAAVPSLVEIYTSRTRDWNFYGLVNLIEICRHKNNPALPEWLELEYHGALRDLLNFAIQDVLQIEDAVTLRQVLASIAIGKGNIKVGESLCFPDESEVEAFVAREFEWTV
jgi:hypothetical protein